MHHHLLLEILPHYLLANQNHDYSAAIAAVATVLVALITGLCAIGAKLVETKKGLRKVESERKSLADELNRQSDALGGFGSLRLEFSRIENEFSELCEHTEIDRVIVLCAWNGATDPKYATAVWQFRRGYITNVNYLRVALDSDYATRLSSCKFQPLHFLTKDLSPGCLIKEIYEREGIEESVWVHLDREEREDGTALNTFMSFSTKKGPITPKTLTACKLVADQVKMLCRI